jgi:hypothetical protein
MASTDFSAAAISGRLSDGPGHETTQRGRLAQQVARLERWLIDNGPARSHEVRRIEELHGRLNAGRFHLAVQGQFKRGKNTLLNALLGESLLPTSVVPLKAVPTFIRLGDAPRIRVSYEEALTAYHLAMTDVDRLKGESCAGNDGSRSAAQKSEDTKHDQP